MVWGNFEKHMALKGNKLVPQIYFKTAKSYKSSFFPLKVAFTIFTNMTVEY